MILAENTDEFYRTVSFCIVAQGNVRNCVLSNTEQIDGVSTQNWLEQWRPVISVWQHDILNWQQII
jgi:hypothetical protein